MAEKSGSEQSKADLRRRIASSRDAVTRDMRGLQYELDFPLKIKKSFQRNTVFWIGGALALGLAIALLRARTHKVYLSAAGKKVRSPKGGAFDSSSLFGLFKMGITLAQPMIISHFAKMGAKKGKRESRGS